jgi:sensor histidine kinase YesM
MKKQIYLISMTSLFLIFFFAVVIYDLIPQRKINLSDGYGDFANFEIDDRTLLNGNWEVYQNQLIGTDNLNINDLDFGYVKLPYINPTNSTKYGYVSYRAVIKNVPHGESLIITLDSVQGGYAIYLNRVLILSNDQIKKGPEKISLEDELTLYTNNQDELEIIIEVSNYDYDFTGLIKAPIISSLKSFRKHFLSNILFKVFIIGALFFAIMYLLFVIGIRNNEKSSIYFSLVIVCGLISLILYRSTYSFYLENIFNIYGSWITYLHHISNFMATIFLLMAIRTYYNIRKSKIVNSLMLILTILIALLPFAFNIRNFLSNILFFNILNIFNILCILLLSLKHVKKNTLNIYISIIIALILLGGIYDALIVENIIPYAEKISNGVFLLCIFLYSLIISFKQEIKLSNVEEIILLNNKIRDTEFTFLNTQIQSHFIYNTLNSIQALCNTNPAKASELIEDFSMYLRTRLEFNKMPMLIDIEDELENIRTYLNIEKERFGNRVNYVYDLKCGDFKIPPLTVQPLVENSVKHGISKKKGGGTLTIATRQDDKFIYIVVSDNGLGFDPKLLNEKQRVGTQNIRHRLDLHLDATLTIDSKPNEGTISIIRIPKKE